MPGPDPHRDLLERATAALEGIERTVDRQARSFDRQAQAFDRQSQTFDRQAQAFDRQSQTFDRHMQALDRHMQALDRQEAGFARMTRRFELTERVLIEAMGEINTSLKRNTARLDDMGDAIRANTQAVLSALDRLGPEPG